MIRALHFLVLMSTLWIPAAYAESSFVAIRLPRGVLVDIPTNWVVLSEHSRNTLQAYVESIVVDASGAIADSEIPFAANYYEPPGNTIGIMNFRYY
jgi:hypothetical protein